MPSTEPSAVPRRMGAQIRFQSSRVGNRPVAVFSVSSRGQLMLQVGDDFANAEHPHGDDHEADAVGELGQVEGVARGP